MSVPGSYSSRDDQESIAAIHRRGFARMNAHQKLGAAFRPPY